MGRDAQMAGLAQMKNLLRGSKSRHLPNFYAVSASTRSVSRGNDTTCGRNTIPKYLARQVHELMMLCQSTRLNERKGQRFIVCIQFGIS